MTKRKTVLSVIAVAVLMISVVAGTYAFFTANTTPSVSSSASVTTGSLTLTLDDAANKGLTTGGAITPTNLRYTTYLSIRNDSPIDVYARILFQGLTNTYSEYLVYSLEQVDSNKASLATPNVIKNQVRVPASASASNKELANYLKVTAGQTQYYKVIIEYLYSQTVDQSSDLNKSFYTGFTIEESGKPTQIISKAGSNLALGDKIAIGDQNFWVISNTSGTIRALAEYNLNVGYIYDADEDAYTEISNSVTGYGLQNSNARGNVSGASTWIGTTPFASASQHGTNNTSYEGSILQSYINAYATLLNSTYGTNITGDAITADEIKSLCNLTGNGTCANTYPWVYTTSYWSGSADSTNYVWSVFSDGNFGRSSYRSGSTFGVRPVIVISESAF